MIRLRKYLSVCLLLSLFLLACTDERLPCLTPKSAYLNIRTLQTNGSAEPVDTALPAAVFFPLSGIDPTSGVVSFNRATFVKSLSPLADSCVWAMSTDTTAGSEFDTMVFYYKRELQFLSNACSYVYFYSLDSVGTTHNNIDSIKILSSSVTNDAKPEHIQIFYHP